jgi:rfaE bifunctional protein nucleotidyltransferase chain/domain
MVKSKIITYSSLDKLSKAFREENKRITISHGVYDLVHPGHIKHLELAKKEGDLLVVSIVPDQYVNKGPGRPIFNEQIRAEMIAALQFVDYVIIAKHDSPIDIIRLLKPAVLAVGDETLDEWVDDPGYREIEQALQEVGGRIHQTGSKKFSSTHLLNAYFDVLTPQANEFIETFHSLYKAEETIDALRRLKDLKVLVIGDAIIDEYHFCRPYGMASKSASIAAQFVSAESHAGGSMAVANHLAGFCDKVNLVTGLGEQNTQEPLIRQALKPNVTPHFFFRDDGPTTVKRRYVQRYLMNKLFEVSYYNDAFLHGDPLEKMDNFLDNHLSEYDLVVVADFGHGLLGPTTINILSRKAKFLALNTQNNSINNGYNLVTRYPRADYVCIDEEETRLAGRDRFGPIEEIESKIASQLGCKIMTTTRGYRGSLTHIPPEIFVQTPVFSREVVDTTGAGDAYFALTAACACQGYSPELVGFIGNVIGALAVRIIGNKQPVSQQDVFRYIETLMR